MNKPMLFVYHFLIFMYDIKYNHKFCKVKSATRAFICGFYNEDFAVYGRF